MVQTMIQPHSPATTPPPDIYNLYISGAEGLHGHAGDARDAHAHARFWFYSKFNDLCQKSAKTLSGP